jgi:ABC-type Na+ transport system ATPase subunit NatA
VLVLHHGKIVANDRVDALQRLATSGTLEEVFSQLVLRDDPARTAADIAEVVVGHA